MKSSFFVLMAAGALAAPVAAQDNHYWTAQFGNRARLLGGAVVGSATDMSAVYYNPGALALVEKPELLLSGTVFQYETLGVENALGPGELVVLESAIPHEVEAMEDSTCLLTLAGGPRG